MIELLIFCAIIIIGVLFYATYTYAPSIVREIIATIKWHTNK